MKLKNVFKILIVFLILFSLSTTVVFAEDYTNPGQFEPYTNTNNMKGIDNFINKSLGTVLNVLQTITFCIAMVLLMIIGIKYMTSHPHEKAEIQKQIPLYFTGVVIFFGASLIMRVVSYLINDILPTY